MLYAVYDIGDLEKLSAVTKQPYINFYCYDHQIIRARYESHLKMKMFSPDFVIILSHFWLGNHFTEED